MTRRKKVIAPSIRRQVIAADNQRCRACGISDPDALQCDHIVPESKGGSCDPANLQTLCGVCNNRKGNTDVGELAVLPPVEGFGDYNDVMARRTEFLELLAVTRQQELESVRAEVAAWRMAGVRGVTIYNRLAKRFPARQVDKFMALTLGMSLLFRMTSIFMA